MKPKQFEEALKRMSRVITFSLVFPSYHPRAGEPTYFVEKVLLSQVSKEALSLYYSYKNIDIMKSVGGYDITALNLKPLELFGPKHHTIRAGHRWKVGDKFSPRVWSGKPYNSKQIQFAPDIEILKVWDFELTFDDLFYIGNELYAYSSSHDALERLAANDGLEQADLLNWFNKPFEGQIICWNEQIEY